MASEAKSGTLRYAATDLPPHPLSALLGFQIVVLILAGIVLTPIIVLRAADAPPQVFGWAVFACLLVSGVTTVIQARPLGVFGAGYVLFMGTSGAFIAVSTTAVKDGGLPLLATLVALSSLVQFAFSARLSLLRAVITPVVGGTMVMLIAVTVFPICFRMLNTVPEGVDAGAGLVTAIATFVVVLAVSLFAPGALRLWGPLFGVLAGSVVGYATGLVDLQRVRDAAWVGLPESGWPGLDLSFDARLWGLLPAFVLVTIVGAIETYGDGIAIQRVSARERQPLDFKSVQGAVFCDGLGNLLSGLMGTLPNTTYSTSISVVEITGVAARRVGIYGGAMMVALAFLPKVSALLQTVPDAVAGAYIMLLLVLLFAHGMRLVAEGGITYETGFVVGLSFWVGIGFQNQLIFSDLMPAWAHTLLDNGMTAGGLTAVLLTLLLSVRNRTRHRIRIAASPSSVPALHALLGAAAGRAGWDQPALVRLQLVGEEALLFLIEKELAAGRDESSEIQVSAREDEGDLVLEFASGPGAENVEALVEELGRSEREPELDAGLRLLSGLAKTLRHEQFHDRNYLSVTVESKALG